MAHFSFFSSAWENVGVASHGTRWCINTLWSATDIKWNREGGREVFSLTHSQTLCILYQPVTACLSDRLPKCTSFWNTLLNNDALRQKAHHHSRTTPSPGEWASKSHHMWKTRHCTLNYLSNLQTKLKPTLLVHIFPASKGNWDCALNGILSPINTAAWLCFWKGCFVPMVGLYWYQGANQTQWQCQGPVVMCWH